MLLLLLLLLLPPEQALKDKLSGAAKADGVSAGAGPVSFGRLAALNRPEWLHGALGLLCAAVVGLQVRWQRCAGTMLLS